MTDLVHVAPAGVLARSTVLADRLADALAKVYARLTANSRRAYRIDWLAWTDWLAPRGIDVLAAHTKDVAAWITEQEAAGYAPKTRSRRVCVLRTIYAALIEAGLCAANPAVGIRIAGGTKARNTPWLTPDEMGRLIGPAVAGWYPTRDRLVVALMVGTALRRASIAGLRVEDVRLDGDSSMLLARTVKNRPGGLELPIPDWLVREIRAWLELARAPKSPGPLFPHEPGSPTSITADRVWQIVKAAGARCGLPEARVSPHAIRRGIATALDQADVPIRKIQAQLGHTNLATTDVYLKALPQLAQSPIEKLDFFGGRQEKP